ncbi:MULTISPECIES: preprotein translocase subunit SecE [Flavobacteriaceae]|uniref:preprotein translocase subunit SecE n=1 Tax=Flavobacteriaceae TaxID=49546 RepID=UPI0010ADF444|nr:MULTISPECIES: preprotein translocase subunit SecE [Flavobacteriaceae]NJB35924.1 preprotein translocase subunit SecE [Croceivirga sp. JEA036]TKD59089.1 preprotein translocase subunit SecE [Flavobacterium sp. ASW18X]
MLTYVKESWEELKNNVTWLSREQASNLMVVVAVFSILFALTTWGIDMFFSDAITGKLVDGSYYSALLDSGFWGVLRIVWYVLLVLAIAVGVNSFFVKKK